MHILWFDLTLSIREFGDATDGNEDVNVAIIRFDIMITHSSPGLDGIMMPDEHEHDVKVAEILVVDFSPAARPMCP